MKHIYFLFFWAVASVCMLVACRQTRSEILFETADSSRTGISFVNRVAEVAYGITVVDYLYHYNGAGLAAADFNKDGLTDLFFVSNHGPNRLYSNRGGMQFHDVTAKAGVQGFSQWKTGVTVADVNGDGWLDIYVCALANYKELEGANELYINNGDDTFTERAADFGLDFSGMATQSVFLDYDHDGDLDMYLLTHGAPSARAYDRVMGDETRNKAAPDRFFRNDDGFFRDFTVQAGIDTASYGFGLGLAIGDANDDGWEDIYVANDFFEGDKLYLNTGSGAFTDGQAYLDYTSRYSHGCDIADLDNDGLDDVLTADIRSAEPLLENTVRADDAWREFTYKKTFGFPLQYCGNTLQRNNGGNFSELSAYAGVDRTGWTWSILAADLNNDGRADVLTTAGIPKNLTALAYLDAAYKDSLRYAIRLSEKHLDEALNTLRDRPEQNRVFENTGDLRFEDRTAVWGFNTAGYTNGAITADLDNDGDLDIATNNINAPAAIYVNKSAQRPGGTQWLSVKLEGAGRNTAGVGARVYVYTRGHVIKLSASATRGYLSSVAAPLHAGLGTASVADSVMVLWPSRNVQVVQNVPARQTITLREQDAAATVSPEKARETSWSHAMLPGFRHRENEYYEFYREPLIPFLVSREGPALAVGDTNGDGLADYFVGGAKRQPGALRLQTAAGSFQDATPAALHADSAYEDVDAAFIDIDNDSDLDLYVVSGGNEFYNRMLRQSDRIYRNDGRGNFARDTLALPLLLQNKSCVRPVDFDNDGDTDLFVGGRITPFRYGAPARSYLLVNNKGTYTDKAAVHAPALQGLGMVTDALWLDADGDGDSDLMVAGEWMPLRLFANTKGRLEEVDIVSETSPVKMLNGLWHSLASADFDHDGDVDIVAGNAGLNTSLRRYGDMRLYTVYMKDLDKHASFIAVPLYGDNRYYPLHTRHEMATVLGEEALNGAPTHDAYAQLTVDAIGRMAGFSTDSFLVVDQWASLYLENDKGKFKASLLPGEAQRSRLFSVCVDDVNADGHADLVAGGNDAGTSPRQRMDAGGRLAVLLGRGDGTFHPWPATNLQSVRGDVRAIRSIVWRRNKAYIIGINNDSVRIFKP